MKVFILDDDQEDIDYLKGLLPKQAKIISEKKHVNEAVTEIDKKSKTISHAVIDIFVPLGGRKIDKKLETYRVKLELSKYTSLSGIALICYLRESYPAMKVMAISHTIRPFLENSNITEEFLKDMCYVEKDDPELKNILAGFLS